jgi:hypothetical protein
MSLRNGIQDFELANPIYKGATVTFYTVSGGVKTATKATLYADPLSTTTLPNPQHLGADGKFVQPVYIEVEVISTISGLTIPDHDTGVIQSVLGSGSSIDLPAVIHAATNKALPVGADEVGIWDSVTGLLNRLSLTNWFAGLGALIAAGTTKATPVDADSVAISDSAAAGATKKSLLSAIRATIFTGWGASIAAGTNKATPVGADMLSLADSAAANATKQITLTNLATFIGTLFAALAGSATQVFSVAAATTGSHALNQTTGDSRYGFLQNNFRLSLTPGVPVTTADVAASSTLYCVPYVGSRISLYSGGAWGNYASAEFSLALSGLTSGKPYDVWAYLSAGTPALEVLVWTNDTTRATALAYQDGVLVKSGDATRRYLGSFYSTSTTETADTGEKRYLYNYYNRVERELLRQETTASWTYQTAVSRIANNAAANIVSVMIGVSEDNVLVTLASFASNANNILIFGGIGLDSTTDATRPGWALCFNSLGGVINATYNARPGIGRHYFSWLESSQASGTTTWRGTALNDATTQGMTIRPGLMGFVMA